MVNKSKVSKLIEYIRDCPVFEVVGESPWLNDVQWDGEVKGEPDNQVLLITWYDDQGQEFSVIITEQGLSDARVERNSIFCADHEGNEVEIAMWQIEPIDIVLDCIADYN